MAIRAEAPGDRAAIAGVVEAAFGQADEARLVDGLRDDGDLALSFVASDGGIIVGHVALSAMRAPQRTLGLAPVAVAPSHWRQGIGAALVEQALEAARVGGWAGVFVLGEPAYYGRFGFTADAARGFASPYAGPYFQYLPLTPDSPAGGLATYAAAFDRL